MGEWLEQNKRAVMLLAVFGVLGGVWLVFFSGLFRSNEIIVLHRFQPGRGLVFSLDQAYELKTVTFSDSSGTELWRLERREPQEGEEIDERKQPGPVETLIYGQGVRGMRQTVKPTAPLTPGESYILQIEAIGGSTTCEIDLPAGR